MQLKIKPNISQIKRTKKKKKEAKLNLKKIILTTNCFHIMTINSFNIIFLADYVVLFLGLLVVFALMKRKAITASNKQVAASWRGIKNPRAIKTAFVKTFNKLLITNKPTNRSAKKKIIF